jgi:hypothetical protein
MAQNDMNIANQGFPAFRADLNDQLEALVTNSSGATAPATTFPHQWWLDTSTTPSTLRQRNAANDAWIVVGLLNQSTNTFNVPVAQGGTGLATLTANNVLLGNGTSAVQAVAPGTSGNVLTSNGTTWQSTAPSGGQGIFRKTNPDIVAWTKTGAGTATTSSILFVEVNGEVRTIASGTSITMPTLAAGTDYAIWCKPDGTLEATSNHTSPPVANSRKVGGFHYAPGGNATGTSGGNTTQQINEYSFWDLKWRPACPDPRGMTLVGNGGFWTGMYNMSANHLTGPVHKYNVDPCRDGNPPQNITSAGNYPNASPANILEALAYHGFRAPNFWEFQLLAFGTTEETSLGGTGPGLTGVLTSGAGTKERFTSQWGVFDATGVLRVWGNDTILTTVDQTLPNPARGARFRYSHFARFGGDWNTSVFSGSRYVDADTATNSGPGIGSRGVCDHLILD